MPVLSKKSHNSQRRKKSVTKKKTEIKKDSIVKFEGRKAKVAWINDDDGGKTGALIYVSPHHLYPPSWRAQISEMELLTEVGVITTNPNIGKW